MLSDSEASPNERGMWASTCGAKGVLLVRNNPFERHHPRKRFVFILRVPYEFGDRSATQTQHEGYASG
jgi:hypothetical protein